MYCWGVALGSRPAFYRLKTPVEAPLARSNMDCIRKMFTPILHVKRLVLLPTGPRSIVHLVLIQKVELFIPWCLKTRRPPAGLQEHAALAGLLAELEEDLCNLSTCNHVHVCVIIFMYTHSIHMYVILCVYQCECVYVNVHVLYICKLIYIYIYTNI